MFECRSCSREIPGDSKLCPYCGATAGASADEATISVPQRPVARDGYPAPSGSSSSSIDEARFTPGTMLAERYRIVGLLGKGGMGEVYRADDLKLRQPVALKFLPVALSSDARRLERFHHEVRVARQVSHPNVCRVYDIGEADGQHFISMEYIDGEDLASVLRRMGKPTTDKAVEIARQLCAGLAAAHDKGVLHRDLKPHNVMIDGSGKVRITDFGLAGFVEDFGGRDVAAGTPAYMAPEQLAGREVSVKSDVYSLGLVLFELFVGKRLFEGVTREQIERVRSTTPTPLTDLSEDIDPAVECVIQRCLELEPSARPSSALAVAAALPGGDPLAAALAAGETPSPELVANARDAGGLRPPIAIGLLVALLVSMAITYYIHAGTTVMPERSPAVLSVVAEQIMEELGYDDLPLNTVSGYDVNAHLSKSLRSSPRPFDELAELDWPPRFRYWRRWAAGEFLPVHFHFPEAFAIDGLTTASKGVGIDSPDTTGRPATIALDSTGRLIGLVVRLTSSDAFSAAIGEVDWSPVFRRAHLEESATTPISMVKSPPVHCDEVAAWRLARKGENGDPLIIQMGASGGRPNYFEILGLDPQMAWNGFRSVTTVAMLPQLSFLILIVMFVLAWRNLRASRGDRRNALRCALLVGGLYALMEVLSAPFDQLIGPGLGEFGRGTGHVLIHIILMWVIYMAIEPYVRRIWPRMLIGVVRLLSGRFRDPAVGREVLIGATTGCALVVVLAMTTLADSLFQTGEFGYLPFSERLWSRLSPGIFLSMEAHRVAWTVKHAFVIATWLIAIRLLIRHAHAAFALGIVVLGGSAYLWFMLDGGESGWPALVYAAFFGIAMATLYTRVGILAGIVAIFVLRPHALFTTDLDSWFTSYGIAELAIVLALAGYGFWVSLAGQPLFRDMLLTEKPARG